MIKINSKNLENRLVKTKNRVYSKGLNSYQVQKIVKLYNDKSIKIGDISKKFNEIQREDNFKPTSFSVSTLYRILNSYQERHEKNYNKIVDYVGFRRKNKNIRQRQEFQNYPKNELETSYFAKFKNKIRNIAYTALAKVSSRFSYAVKLDNKIDNYGQEIKYIKNKYLENEKIERLNDYEGLEKMISPITNGLLKIKKRSRLFNYQVKKIEKIASWADYYSLNICALKA